MELDLLDGVCGTGTGTSMLSRDESLFQRERLDDSIIIANSNRGTLQDWDRELRNRTAGVERD